MSTQIIRPVRSISYNDIKRRRLVRQSKSKGKLRSSQASTQVVQTEKKVYPHAKEDMYERERPNQIEQIKQIISKKTNNSQEVKNTIKKRNKIDFINFTERVDHKNSKARFSHLQNQQNRLSCANSRQIIKQLIQESKSQRKLLKYSELRNQFKLSKSRSQSKSAKSLVQKSKILAKKFLGIDLTPQKPPQSSPIKGIKNSHRVKKFQSVKQTADSSHKHSFRYLVSASNQRNQFFKGNHKRKIPTKLQNQIQSSIQAQRQSSMFDSQQDRKFIQDLCFKYDKEKEQKNYQISMNQNKQKILDLLDAQQSELYKYFGKKQRQKKLANDLQKLNKKFPKGFFKL